MPFSFDEIRSLFVAKGDRLYSGEPVTQLEHALQSAQLAEQAGASAALIVAALLHDLGHLLNDQGDTPTLRGIDDRHEYVAIPRLRELFPAAVVEPIRLHVDAKRYLCARGDACTSGVEYLAALSEDSKRSLQLQGGVFDDKAAETFIAQPFAADAVRLRLWDDLAKIEALTTPTFDYYIAMAQQVAGRS